MTGKISDSDAIQHIVKIGLDTLPPIRPSSMLTRLNAFGEEARQKWDEMYQDILSGDSFSISHSVYSLADRSAKAKGPSFVLVDRGPVFIYPLVLPDLNKTNVADRWDQWFREAFEFFCKRFAEIKIVRLGMVRELVFRTATMSCVDVLRADGEFAGGRLVQGQLTSEYQTEDTNIIVTLAPATITKSMRLPVGQAVSREEGYGLVARLDVNNRVVHELEGTDIEKILATAGSLWPQDLLDYINGRFDS